jgi:hypothetical protein
MFSVKIHWHTYDVAAFWALNGLRYTPHIAKAVSGRFVVFF